MGDHGAREWLGNILPSGLLPRETTNVTQVLDADRWTKAEEQTSELIARIQPNQSSEERRNAVADYVQRLIANCLSCRVSILTCAIRFLWPDSSCSSLCSLVFSVFVVLKLRFSFSLLPAQLTLLTDASIVNTCTQCTFGLSA